MEVESRRSADVTQRRIVLILAIAIGLTRFVAIAHSMFDWDEALFSLGVRDYEVADHRPHPPGYPLYIAAAKVIALTGLDAFRCLQVVVVLGALFLFPALYLLAREIGFDVPTAVAGAAVYAFLPNVWIYGGTAFSDVPATTLVFLACALLLRGRRDARAYVYGAILLGIAAGIRPANLLVGAVPALLATGAQLRAKAYRTIALAMLLGALIVGGSYVGAALASRSVRDYINIVREQSQYVHDIDSWHNPGRPSLYEAAKAFILWPFEQEDVLNAIAIAATLSTIGAIVRKRFAPLLTLAIFTPLAVMSWLNLDISTPARYAIGYMAAHALLAADGFLLFGRKAQVALCAATIVVLIVWSWPALRSQRTTDAPPVAALLWVRENVPPTAPVYVHGTLGPLADYILAGRRPNFFEEAADIPASMGDAWVVDRLVREGSQSFVRRRTTLWKVLRRRNFEASVSRASRLQRFGDGWYPEESDATHAFHWMKKEGAVLLPAMNGSGVLAIELSVPRELRATPPTLEVRWNGQPLAMFAAATHVKRSWTLPSRNDGNELRIVTSATVVPASRGHSIDTRELGLQLDRLSWMPAH
jgi:hypothetical protein